MLFAEDVWYPKTFEHSLLAAAAFGALGIFLLVVGFKVFDLVTPRLNLEKELAEKNVAVGIMVGALLISIALIVTRAIGN